MSDSSKVIIRPAQQPDLSNVIVLRQALFSSANPNDTWAQGDPEAWINAYKQLLTAEISNRETPQDMMLTLIAERNQELVGTLTAMILPHLPNPSNPSGKEGWIQGVFISPKARKLGIAYRLTHFAQQWFIDRGVSSIALDSTPMAMDLYLKAGFTVSTEAHLTKELGAAL